MKTGFFILSNEVAAELQCDVFEHQDIIWLENAPPLLGKKYDAAKREFYILETDDNGDEIRRVIHAH